MNFVLGLSIHKTTPGADPSDVQIPYRQESDASVLGTLIVAGLVLGLPLLSANRRCDMHISSEDPARHKASVPHE